MERRPLAVTNWKMAMTVEESLAYFEVFLGLVAGLLRKVEVLVAPPCTCIQPLSKRLAGTSIRLGGQNMAATSSPSRTGQISGELLIDAGCSWVMLGHWEVRHYLGDTDEAICRKMALAFEAGLQPVLLVGEGKKASCQVEKPLARQLEALLNGLPARQMMRTILVYEPESAIGAQAPATIAQIEEGCGFIRAWIGERWSSEVQSRVRVLYGGGVTPETASELLGLEGLDGLGTTRAGREPHRFAALVRLIAERKG